MAVVVDPVGSDHGIIEGQRCAAMHCDLPSRSSIIMMPGTPAVAPAPAKGCDHDRRPWRRPRAMKRAGGAWDDGFGGHVAGNVPPRGRAPDRATVLDVDLGVGRYRLDDVCVGFRRF